MSDSVSLAHSILSMEAANTRQAVQMEIVRQSMQADASVLGLLQQAVAEPAAQQAVLPEGQGAQVDVTV